MSSNYEGPNRLALLVLINQYNLNQIQIASDVPGAQPNLIEVCCTLSHKHKGIESTGQLAEKYNRTPTQKLARTGTLQLIDLSALKKNIDQAYKEGISAAIEKITEVLDLAICANIPKTIELPTSNDKSLEGEKSSAEISVALQVPNTDAANQLSCQDANEHKTINPLNIENEQPRSYENGKFPTRESVDSFLKEEREQNERVEEARRQLEYSASFKKLRISQKPSLKDTAVVDTQENIFAPPHTCSSTTSQTPQMKANNFKLKKRKSNLQSFAGKVLTSSRIPGPRTRVYETISSVHHQRSRSPDTGRTTRPRHFRRSRIPAPPRLAPPPYISIEHTNHEKALVHHHTSNAAKQYYRERGSEPTKKGLRAGTWPIGKLPVIIRQHSIIYLKPREKIRDSISSIVSMVEFLKWDTPEHGERGKRHEEHLAQTQQLVNSSIEK